MAVGSIKRIQGYDYSEADFNAIIKLATATRRSSKSKQSAKSKGKLSVLATRGEGDVQSVRPKRAKHDNDKRETYAERKRKEAPRKLVDEAITKNDWNKEYKPDLKALSEDLPTAEQFERLDEVKICGPNYLGRTASLTYGHAFDTTKPSTNGFTAQTLMMPAADTHTDQAVHASLADMKQGELVYMIGHHLIWTDKPEDEFLSYSIDPLFLVVHALNRYHEGQGGVTIQFFDRRKAKTINHEPAVFYPALALYEAFEVPNWKGWRGQSATKLHPRKFTQEFLSHGTIRVDDGRFQQVSVETLIRDGLYNLFPEFRVQEDHLRAGLYTGQVLYRTIGYPPGNVQARRYRRIYSYSKCSTPVPFTVDFLRQVQKLTLNFMSTSSDEEMEVRQPHLHIFLSFLTLHKRVKSDPVFMEWMKKSYTADEVKDLYDDGNGGVQKDFTRVANNLPGVLQYLDLVRDAISAFGLPNLPANVIEKVNAFTGEPYADEDAKQHRKDVLSTKYDKDKQQEDREKARGVYKARKDKKRQNTVDGVSLITVLDASSQSVANVDGGIQVATPSPSSGSTHTTDGDGEDSKSEDDTSEPDDGRLNGAFLLPWKEDEDVLSNYISDGQGKTASKEGMLVPES